MADTVIITPTKNRSDPGSDTNLLEKTIYSVRSQTFKDYAHLIVDDDSNDMTEDLVHFYMEKDPRILYLHRDKSNDEKPNASCARNLGLAYVFGSNDGQLTAGQERELEQAEFITFLDDDDLLPEHSLAMRRAVMKKNPDLGMVYGNEMLFRDNGNGPEAYRRLRIANPKPRHLRKKILFKPSFPHLSTMWRREVAENIGYFDPDIGFGEDKDYVLRGIAEIMRAGCGVAHIDEFVLFYRMHDGERLSTFYLGNGQNFEEMKEVEKKNMSSLDYRMFVLKRVLSKPHSFLPEAVKVVLRPVRDFAASLFLQTFVKDDLQYSDDFLYKIEDTDSDFLRPIDEQ